MTKPYIIPPPTVEGANVAGFDKMRFDEQHYERAYNQCRGRGGNHEECKNINADTYITPTNPAIEVFKPEILGFTQCMTAHNDIEKCKYFSQTITEVNSYQAPAPTKGETASNFISRLLA